MSIDDDEPSFKPVKKFYDTHGNEIIGDPSQDEVDDEPKESKQWASTSRDSTDRDERDGPCTSPEAA